MPISVFSFPDLEHGREKCVQRQEPGHVLLHFSGHYVVMYLKTEDETVKADAAGILYGTGGVFLVFGIYIYRFSLQECVKTSVITVVCSLACGFIMLLETVFLDKRGLDKALSSL